MKQDKATVGFMHLPAEVRMRIFEFAATTRSGVNIVATCKNTNHQRHYCHRQDYRDPAMCSWTFSMPFDPEEILEKPSETVRVTDAELDRLCEKAEDSKMHLETSCCLSLMTNHTIRAEVGEAFFNHTNLIIDVVAEHSWLTNTGNYPILPGERKEIDIDHIDHAEVPPDVIQRFHHFRFRRLRIRQNLGGISIRSDFVASQTVQIDRRKDPTKSKTSWAIRQLSIFGAPIQDKLNIFLPALQARLQELLEEKVKGTM